MGKKGDPKVPILPSRTRRGTALSTSAKLDSPSVMSQFDSPHLHATSAESGTMSNTIDDASTTFETTGSLGSFIEEQIVGIRSRKQKKIRHYESNPITDLGRCR